MRQFWVAEEILLTSDKSIKIKDATRVKELKCPTTGAIRPAVSSPEF